MSAGSRYEYMWADGVAIKVCPCFGTHMSASIDTTQMKKPIKVCAAEYIDYCMTWVEGQFSNEAIFPTTIGTTV